MGIDDDIDDRVDTEGFGPLRHTVERWDEIAAWILFGATFAGGAVMLILAATTPAPATANALSILLFFLAAAFVFFAAFYFRRRKQFFKKRWAKALRIQRKSYQANASSLAVVEVSITRLGVTTAELSRCQIECKVLFLGFRHEPPVRLFARPAKTTLLSDERRFELLRVPGTLTYSGSANANDFDDAIMATMVERAPGPDHDVVIAHGPHFVVVEITSLDNSLASEKFANCPQQVIARCRGIEIKRDSRRDEPAK